MKRRVNRWIPIIGIACGMLAASSSSLAQYATTEERFRLALTLRGNDYGLIEYEVVPYRMFFTVASLGDLKWKIHKPIRDLVGIGMGIASVIVLVTVVCWFKSGNATPWRWLERSSRAGTPP